MHSASSATGVPSLISLGANVGDCRRTVSDAAAELARHFAIRDFRISSLWRTQPVGGPAGQSEFINAAAYFETDLTPHELMNLLLETERNFGRFREQRWGPRTLDLDLLLYGPQILGEHNLVVPHPRMSFRKFVLEPACEAAPQMIHPEIGLTLAALLNHLKCTPPVYLVVGGSEEMRRQLLHEAAGRLSGACVVENINELAELVASPGSRPLTLGQAPILPRQWTPPCFRPTSTNGQHLSAPRAVLQLPVSPDCPLQQACGSPQLFHGPRLVWREKSPYSGTDEWSNLIDDIVAAIVASQ